MKRSESAHGFTLVELLAILFIMGILAAVAFPNYMAFVNIVRLLAGW